MQPKVSCFLNFCSLSRAPGSLNPVANLRTIKSLMAKSSMAFTQRYNPLTGSLEWEPRREDYDYRQEMARSGYADMLHDEERNRLYFQAIEKTMVHLNSVRPKDDLLRVVDIGTGTGLLSMMAATVARSLKRKVNIRAYECFDPMAICAEKVIKRNGFHEVIKVINKRSDQDKDSPSPRGDLLVTEVFDTELIGEGALQTYRCALERNMKPNPFAVPSKARVWIQLVESEMIHKWNQFEKLTIDSEGGEKHLIVPPEACLKCNGSGQLQDIQMSQMKVDSDFKIITEPKVAFEFDFTDIDTLKLEERKKVELEVVDDCDEGRLVVMMWWDLFMDWEHEILLSCAPFWAHPDKDMGQIAWRDHWIQAIYHFPANYGKFNLKKNETFSVEAYHDDYTLAFAEWKPKEIVDIKCGCGLHSHLSRSRLGLINDDHKLQAHYNAFKERTKDLREKANVLYLGDASLVPVMIATCFAEAVNKVYCVSNESRFNREFFLEFGKENGCDQKMTVLDKIEEIPGGSGINVIVSEPYFGSIDLPWDALHFWHLLKKVSPFVEALEKAVILPDKANVKMIPIQLDHLWKIRAKVGNDVQGFDLTDFDELVQNAIRDSDACIESQPLWEYPGKALIQSPVTLFEWEFRSFTKLDTSKSIFESKGSFIVDPKVLDLNNNHVSVAFWMEFVSGDECIVTTGPVKPIRMGQNLVWERNWKQGVAFFFVDLKEKIKGQLPDEELLRFDFKAEFDLNRGLLQFNCL